MNGSFVQIQGLSKTFVAGKPPQLANIEAFISKGEIVGLVGPDGAGKTTLLRLMAGLLTPTEGHIEIGGLDTIRDGEEVHAITGYMPQRFGLYEDLTVLENLELYAELRGLEKEKKEATFTKLLQFTALAPFTKRLARDLSGGMKQKLGLACALLKKPELLLLDEPSVGVDPISRRELWKMVTELLDDRIAIVWSTSYLDEAEKCHTVLLLNEGKLHFFGKPVDLVAATKATKFEDAFVSLLGKKEATVVSQEMPKINNSIEFPIVADQLTKRFGSFVAVDKISFQVRRGEIFGLLGPNGAGKSTTFKMLCGLLQPSEGSATVSGLNLAHTPGEARARIGYMAQKFSLYGDLTIRQNLEFFASVYNLSGEAKKEAIDRMVEMFFFEPYLNNPCSTLPLGIKQKLSLAAATMHRPNVLFLDEPTSGMDPISRREFWEHAKKLAMSGCTIMISTHFMDEAQNCDRIALIYRGKVIRLDTPDALKQLAKSETNLTPTLEDAFIKIIEDYNAGV